MKTSCRLTRPVKSASRKDICNQILAYFVTISNYFHGISDNDSDAVQISYDLIHTILDCGTWYLSQKIILWIYLGTVTVIIVLSYYSTSVIYVRTSVGLVHH